MLLFSLYVLIIFSSLLFLSQFSLRHSCIFVVLVFMYYIIVCRVSMNQAQKIRQDSRLDSIFWQYILLFFNKVFKNNFPKNWRKKKWKKKKWYEKNVDRFLYVFFFFFSFHFFFFFCILNLVHCVMFIYRTCHFLVCLFCFCFLSSSSVRKENFAWIRFELFIFWFSSVQKSFCFTVRFLLSFLFQLSLLSFPNDVFILSFHFFILILVLSFFFFQKMQF